MRYVRPNVCARAVVATFAEAEASAVSLATELEAASSFFEATTDIPAGALRLPDTLDGNKLVSKHGINDLMQRVT